MAAQAQSPQGVFLTGTDTGVGKTVIGSSFVRALHTANIAVQPRKPVESGIGSGECDSERYAAAVDGVISQSVISPYRFTAALAPPIAAAMESQKITVNQLTEATLGNNPHNDFIVVEAAGGFYSPIAQDGSCADLAEALQFPIVLVAANRLGCINHICLSVEAIERRGLQLTHIVLNSVSDDPALEHSNLSYLNHLFTNRLLQTSYKSGQRFVDPSQIQPLVDFFIPNLKTADF